MRLDPRTKLGMVLLVSLAIFMLEDWRTILAAFAFSAVLWRASGLRLADLHQRAKPLRFLFFFLILAQGLLYPGETPVRLPFADGLDLGPFAGGATPFTWEGLSFGASLCLRVLTLASTVPLLLATTGIEEIVLGLTKLGLPYRTAYLATTALNQVPVLRQDIEAIVQAQRLRGSEAFGRGHIFKKLRAYPALAVPLVMTAMRRANLMGIAMEARAFGSGKNRSSLHTLRFAPADGFAAAAAVLIFLGLVLSDRIFR